MLPDQAPISKVQFQRLFVLVPGLSCSLAPSLIVGTLFGEWGSNPLWGSYFGLGWCLSAFWSVGQVHDRLSTDIGLIWGWLALLPLYSGAGWLWDRATPRRRRIAVRILWLSSLPMLPARAMLALDAAGIHLPDYITHLATSY
jgi:hypothetical protein